MEKVRVFYSSLCPDTGPFFAELERLTIPVEGIDITESMRNLKQFLAVRDHETAFVTRKELGMVGVPCLVTTDDDYIFEVADLADYAAKISLETR
ncbi:glutaredoxin [Granulicatella seriolae]|uniref:Glutaredoxin n=1 Tax=Granulicatella seriolae TaxID=2967226 RepID=A0ABT1WN38_9LACT|nr:glutaredoxin [Granulicatella seriolae]